MINKLKQLIEKYNIMQFIKFNIVGIINTAVDYAVYFLLVYAFNMQNHSLAQAISFSCGILNSFIFNSKWTFKNSEKKGVSVFVLFLVVNFGVMGISVLLLKFCEQTLHVQSAFWSKILISPAILFINYFANKWLVFGKTSKA